MLDTEPYAGGSTVAHPAAITGASRDAPTVRSTLRDAMRTYGGTHGVAQQPEPTARPPRRQGARIIIDVDTIPQICGRYELPRVIDFLMSGARPVVRPATKKAPGKSTPARRLRRTTLTERIDVRISASSTTWRFQ